MAVVSISLPDALLERADAFADDRGYAGRSELFRAALRSFLADEQELAEAETRSATLTLVYPDEIEERISEIRHRYSDVVQAMMHGHTEEACLELFMLRGEAERVTRFVDALRGLREARLVEPTFVDPPPAPVRP